MTGKKKIIIGIIALGLTVVLVVSLILLRVNKTASSNNLATTTDQTLDSVQDLLDENYTSLYESRKYFNSEVKKLHEASQDMKFLWHPDQEKREYQTVKKQSGKEEIEETVVNIGKYKLTVTSPFNQDILDNEFFYTHVVLTLNGTVISSKDYKNVALSHIYKIQVSQTYYYLFGLCGGGNHGCGTLVPVVNDGETVVVGNSIEDVDFSNYLSVDDFFTKNGELYTILDDSRYFFSYLGSNNASYNSAVPRIFKFDKATGDHILVLSDFRDLYKKSTQMIGDDLNKLRNSIPRQNINTEMNTLRGKSLIPYFDYYLGMSIISGRQDYSKIRDGIEKLYVDFYGSESAPEAHFDGYKDFEG